MIKCITHALNWMLNTPEKISPSYLERLLENSCAKLGTFFFWGGGGTRYMGEKSV